MKVVDIAIKIKCNKNLLKDAEKVKRNIELKRKEKPYKLPRIKFKSNIEKMVINNSDIYRLYNNESNKIILYLHGGSYINESSIFHLRFVDKLSYMSNIDIYYPIYPLAPNHTYKDAYLLILKLYKKLLKENKEIILMGDSAGGGLALGFAMYLKKLNIKLPNKLVLLSPWVDITLSNPSIEEFEKNDPMLSCYGLVEYAKLWAGDLDLKDYKLSPINGDLSNLPDTLIFTGTNEILYPDLILFDKKLQKNKVKSELIIGKNMNHVYPLYIKKKESLEKIINFILN